MMKLVKTCNLLTGLIIMLTTLPVKSAEGFWLDQYNALYYLITLQLDSELIQMKARGSKLLILQSDSLPSIVSNFIAWRAKDVARLESIAWIQKPNKHNLVHASQLTGFLGVQIDDHYFSNPPISLFELQKILKQKQLWCSFQPYQFSFDLATKCDQADIQIYRKSCLETLDMAWHMGITGNRKIAVATYEDGSRMGEHLSNCISNKLNHVETRHFIFKWKNQEVWTKKVWHLLAKLRQRMQISYKNT